uniref:Putative thrombospondin n=1 Tax=Ixodes ricinus TaxID=34613 RepID=A0A6B0U5B5_IXORI
MQLVLFIVIVTFTPLSCEVQSESIPVIVGEMNKLPEDCKEKLIQEMKDQCSGHIFQPTMCVGGECVQTCSRDYVKISG